MTCGCTPTGMCSPLLPQIIEMELPPIESYLHVCHIGTWDVCILSLAAFKQLGVWLHCINMMMTKEPGRVDSIQEKDHKMGNLLDYLLMPGTSTVMWEEVLAQVIVENIETLQGHLEKSKKALKKAWKTHGRLLTIITGAQNPGQHPTRGGY